MNRREVKRAPVLRFKGFTNDWEQRKLKDCLEINSGRDYKHLHSGNIPVFGTGGYMLSVDEALSYKNAIGIGRKGTIDKPQLLIAPFWTVDTLFFLTPENDTDLYFLFSFFQKVNWKKYDESTGLPSLSKKTISTIKIKTPSKNEQIKIGTLIQKVNNLISLQQRKNSQLKELKNSIFQKIITKKGTPKIRFNGYFKDWNLKKLGQIANVVGGGTPSTKNRKYWNGNINWYSPTEIGSQDFISSSQKKITELGLQHSSAKLLPGKHTILFTSRAGIGNMAIMQTDGCTNQGFQSWIVNTKETNIYFLYTLGKNIKHEAIRKASGSTFLEISNSEVKKLLLSLPEKNEQDKLGNLFFKIDKIINYQEQNIKKIRQFKQFLLQNMFI